MAVAMSVVYTTINGVLYHENRGGVETEYVPDTLGCLIGCRDSSGNVTYTADYWPYGEVRTSTGSKTSPWGFVGLLGYLTDLAKRLYVRARHYRPNVGQWQTVDPLWPEEKAYEYVKHGPILFVDPIGTQMLNGNDQIYGDGFRKLGRETSNCATCASRMYTQWFPHPAHLGNHRYSHCMSCCVLTLLDGEECAGTMQALQVRTDMPFKRQFPFIDFPARHERNVARDTLCKGGMEVAKGSLIPFRNTQLACEEGCSKKYPNKPLMRILPPFPYLPECNPSTCREPN
jgi:hypothetical protein